LLRFLEIIVCGEGEWSRGDASDMDGTGREAEVSGSERVNWWRRSYDLDKFLRAKKW
jgi:hypothetical protein